MEMKGIGPGVRPQRPHGSANDYGPNYSFINLRDNLLRYHKKHSSNKRKISLRSLF